MSAEFMAKYHGMPKNLYVKSDGGPILRTLLVRYDDYLMGMDVFCKILLSIFFPNRPETFYAHFFHSFDMVTTSKPKVVYREILVLVDKSDVIMGSYRINLFDFCETAEYILRNSNLIPNDPRLKLIRIAKTNPILEITAIAQRFGRYDHRVTLMRWLQTAHRVPGYGTDWDNPAEAEAKKMWRLSCPIEYAA